MVRPGADHRNFFYPVSYWGSPVALAAGRITSGWTSRRWARRRDGGALGHPAFAGFELEDGIYLIGPVTWLGGLLPCFIISSVGPLFFSCWTLRKFVGKTGACQGP